MFFWICYIKPYFKIKFLAIHLKYILRYCLPLIPYALSGVILEQFGKFAISNQQSLSQAGFYTLALTISSIVSIVISVTHQAWNPYYFEYMNSKNYDKLDSEFIRILKITIIVAFGVAAFGIDIGILLAKNTFTGYLHLIPIFTIGHVFNQISYAYLRNFGYSKKMEYMTLAVIVSGIINLFLNLTLIRLFSELGAALSFALSYLILTIISFLLNHYFVKLHSTSVSKIIKTLSVVIPFYFLLYYLFGFQGFIISFFFKFRV